MRQRFVGLLLCLCLCVATAPIVAAEAGGVRAVRSPGAPTSPLAIISQPDENDTAAIPPNGTGPLGAHVSSFFQSNVAHTTASVRTGMWVSAYERSVPDNRSALLARQLDRVDERIAALEARKRALDAARRNGSIPPVVYRAEMGRIVGHLAALTEAIEETRVRAEAAGTALDRVTALREEAAALADPSVRAVAIGLTQTDSRAGPPAWLESLSPGQSGRSGPSTAAPGAGDDRGRNRSERANTSGTGRGSSPGRNATEGTPGNSGRGKGGGRSPSADGRGSGNRENGRDDGRVGTPGREDRHGRWIRR